MRAILIAWAVLASVGWIWVAYQAAELERIAWGIEASATEAVEIARQADRDYANCIQELAR